MFTQARITLTLWYLAIIFLICSLFSLAFYNVATREVRRVVERIERGQESSGSSFEPRPQRPGMPTLEDLQESSRRLRISLILLNAVVLGFAGAAAYFLAGKTLKPISEMLNQQNIFISNSSHELRTPLATLRAEIEGSLLEKKISDGQARNILSSNLEEISRLQTLADNLLQITALKNTSLDSKAAITEMLPLVTRAIERVKPLAQEKNIAITTHLVDAQIRAVALDIENLFVILLENAVKYSGKNTTISVRSKLTDKHVSISVADQGIGVPEKDLPHIFDRFYRSDASRSQTTGFGLGLSIAQTIVRSHGGSIAAASTQKSGSTFTLTLPRQS